MSVYTFWIIICAIICVTLVMITTIISADWKNSEVAKDNEEMSDEQLERAGDIFAKAICKNIFEQEDKNGRD